MHRPFSTEKGKQKMAQDRYYRFKCITYVDDITLRRNLCKYADHFAYIYHGEEEAEPHFHVLITFRGNKSIKRVREILSEGSTQNTLAQPIDDIDHDILYLTHDDDASIERGKQRYSPDKIVYDDTEYWTKIAKESPAQKISNEEFIDDLTKGIGFSHIEMAKKYGRDYIRNLRAYMTFRKIAMIEQGRNEEYLIQEKELEDVFGDNLE